MICKTCGDASSEVMCIDCGSNVKLGRMIRKLSAGDELGVGPHNSWWLSTRDKTLGPYHAPEQALEAAGIKDE